MMWPTLVLASAVVNLLLVVELVRDQRRRSRGARLLVSLFASINRVRAVCDEWDRYAKGESPTSKRIRAAIGDVP